MILGNTIHYKLMMMIIDMFGPTVRAIREKLGDAKPINNTIILLLDRRYYNDGLMEPTRHVMVNTLPIRIMAP